MLPGSFLEEANNKMTDQHHDRAAHEPPPVSLSHLFHTVRSYLPIIAMAMAAIMVTYAVFALLSYLTAPRQRVTSRAFRLAFERAAAGEYPNGTKFSSAEIVATPVLLKVYQENDLARYVTFPQFAEAVFILESSEAYNALVLEYQARLADPRLSTIDRERIQKEYDLKRASLSKADLTINFLRTKAATDIPVSLAYKVLDDILVTWAAIAANEQHVLEYQISVLSPDFIRETELERKDPVIAIHVLRSKIIRAIENIELIRDLPSAELARTKKDRVSLADIKLRLEDMVRFRLEPLASSVRPTDTASAIHFLERQLAYDMRVLKAHRDAASSVREALAVYEKTQPQPSSAMQPANGETTTAGGNSGNDSVVLNEGFLDRLISLTSNSADVLFRQKLVDEYRKLQMKAIPLEFAVAYDTQILGELRSGGRGAAPAPEDAIQQINVTRSEVQALLVSVNEIYQLVSRHLNPSTHLYTPTAPPVTRTERSVSLARLALYGGIVFLLSLPVVIGLCLLHHRVRVEEYQEAHALQEAENPA